MKYTPQETGKYIIDIIVILLFASVLSHHNITIKNFLHDSIYMMYETFHVFRLVLHFALITAKKRHCVSVPTPLFTLFRGVV